MREIRQSGSEGGGGGASPYPYSSSRVPRPMAGTSQDKPGHDGKSDAKG